MKYDLIIFDLGNVVVMFDHHISAGKFAARFGLDKAFLYALFFDSKITQLHDEGKISSAEFYRRIKRILGIDIGYDEFKDYWNDIFFTNPGMVSLIKTLKKRYTIYLMSNTNRLHFNFIRKKFPVIKSFDKLILSCEVGKLKPHPKIYKYALRLAGTPPRKTIYIDDRKELAEGARLLGMNTIVFRNLRQLKKELSSYLNDY